jgi:hypothetical protein
MLDLVLEPGKLLDDLLPLRAFLRVATFMGGPIGIVDGLSLPR